MSKRWLYALVLVWAVGFLGTNAMQAQQTGDQIYFNAKIITVDNESFTPNLGTIAEAMHVQNGKILHVGTNAQIRAMGGPNTKMVDLKGRTVIPGIIPTHEHPWDWMAANQYVLKKVIPDDKIIVRFLENSPEENLLAFPRVLNEAVQKAKPGQWIYFVFTYGKNYEFSIGGNGGYGRGGLDPKAANILAEGKITKEMLDAAAPNNPVVLRDVFTSMVINQKAIDAARAVIPREFFVQPGQSTDNPAAGISFRWMFSDVVMKDFYRELLEIARLDMEWWAGYGITTFASNAYAPSNLRVYGELDRTGQMPLRNMWTWNWRHAYFYADPYWLYQQALMIGKGTDFLWYGGGRNASGSGCTDMEPVKVTTAEEALRQAGRQRCSYAPDSPGAKMLYDWVKAGGRYVNAHTVADKDIDNLMDVIEKASKDAGMTEEQIRAKRHTFDHSVLAPRQDQIPRLKRLGVIADANIFEIHQATPMIFETFGERAVSQVVPLKRLTDAGINTSLEMDRVLATTNFTYFSGFGFALDRKGWDGRIYGADQKIDRESLLKTATIRGAYYTLRENVLGSLKPGKWADFTVLDRDYLTVPVEDIANTRVLMTVVGGKVVHLVPSVARELGMQPTGSQVTLGAAASKW